MGKEISVNGKETRNKLLGGLSELTLKASLEHYNSTSHTHNMYPIDHNYGLTKQSFWDCQIPPSFKVQ